MTEPPSEPRVAPYGSWTSPITPALVVSRTVSLGLIALDGDDVYWLEGRPAEAGRNVLVRRAPDGRTADVTPQGYNVRTRVHEYGGGDYAVRNGVVFFSSFADQRVYRQDRGGAPRAITPEAAKRYADYVVDRSGRRLFAVCEDKRRTLGPEDVNTLVALDADSGAETTIAAGREFYASPRLSPDERSIAYLAWDHPSMPWDAAELWLGAIGAEARRIAGGDGESVFQPTFGPDGALYFVSDRSGYWNLHRLRDGAVKALCPRPAEFGVAQWVFGLSTYAFADDATLVCAFSEAGTWRLGRIDLATLAFEPIDTPYTSISGMRGRGGRVVMIAGSFTEAPAVVELDVATGRRRVFARSSELDLDAGYLSVPQAVLFPTSDGATAHALYYRPKSAGHVAPPGERPPLIVRVHGGPTGAASSALAPGGVQFWTSRGFAVVDVNYGGSTGFGRAYRERLRGRWGITDVDDCVAAATHLVDRGEADPDRLIISGGSAGGYTVLRALTCRDVFRAGASHYGIADLEMLAEQSRTVSPHKFESRYEDGLIAPYPERVDVYRERSPVHAAERVSCPVIFFQGTDDRVVPPSQAQAMVASLRARGLTFSYLAFEAEGHGFRRAETIRRALEAELSFYAQVFGFELAGPIEPVAIENLGATRGHGR